jgi:hypothetical protein
MQLIRKISAVAVGVVVAGGVIALTESAAHGRLGGEGPFIGAVIGYGLGAAAGTVVAAKIASAGMARLVPVLLALLALINLFAFPHPIWFVPAAAAALAAGCYIGLWLAGRWTGPVPPKDDAA